MFCIYTGNHKNTRAGPEFGSKQGLLLIIVRSLYGLKSSGACWHEHLAKRLSDLGYRSCFADPDVWMCPGAKPCGFCYWEYILVYVEDILVISHDPSKSMYGLERECWGTNYLLKRKD